MFNFVQEGESVDIDIPGGGCSSTTPVLLGNGMVGVPQSTYGAGSTGVVNVKLCGVFKGLPLKTGDTPVLGDKLYWDAGNAYLTTTASSYVWAGWAWGAPVGDGTIALKLIC